MNRSIIASAIDTIGRKQLAPQTGRRLLIGAIIPAVFAILYLFIGGSVPETPLSPIVAALSQSAPLTTPAQVREAYGQLPLSFEANHGQADESINYLARGAGYTLSLSPTGAVFVLAQRSDEHSQSGNRSPSRVDKSGVATPATLDTDTSNALGSEQPAKVLRMNLLGANRGASAEGLNELEGRVNYFTGNDPAEWRTNIQTFGRVRYNEVYPGIDLVYYGSQRLLEYDFVVAPGRDARAIALEFAGADKVEVDAAGELLLTLGESIVRQPKPVVYQELSGERRAIEGGYVLDSRGRVSFHVGEYDRSAPLVIDPVIAYSTYLGGSDTEDGNDIKVDSAGNAYVCGNTASTNFPTANAIQATFGGATFAGGRDGFITKLNATGTAFVYSTYFGSDGDDRCNKIAVDSTGNAYVAGETTSTNFPTLNAIQSAFGGGLSDAFVAKLDASGSALIYSTYLGGNIFDAASGIALDSSNNVYVTGRTTSPNYPTANAIQATQASPNADAFVTKIDASGSALVYSTYLGGSGGEAFDAGFSIAVDASGSAYVTGQTTSTNFPTLNPIQAAFGGGSPDGDAFVTKIHASGLALVYSTYLGGVDNDIGFEIAVDSAGSAHLTGVTRSANFPTANPIQPVRKGASDAFVTKLNAAGMAFIYSTYLGGSIEDSGNGIALDSSGNVYIAAGTSSADFPTANPIQGASGGGIDATVTKFNPFGTAILFSTYLGGSGGDAALAIAVDSATSMYITGRTTSTNLPTTNPVQAANGGGQDAFVSKLAPSVIISGKVTSNGVALSGVTVTLGGSLSATTTTNASGNYSLAVALGGSYTVTPSKTGYTFTPSSQSFTNLSSNQTANFTATALPPVAGNDAYSTAEDTALNIAAPGVLGNDTDPAGNTLTASIVSLPTHGTVTLNSNGSFTYTPANNYNGADSFTYRANHGTSNSNTATVAITINAVNDAPVNTVPGAQTANLNTTLTFSAANSNRISISDVDAASAAVRVTLTATGGTLSLSGLSGLSFTAGDGTGDATMTFTGTIANINAALNGLRFTPTTNFTGAASLQIITNDQGATGAGGSRSDTDNVAITVVDARRLQLSSAAFNASEVAGRATITVTRTGNASQPASVDYATSDLSGLNNCNVNTGNASQRCDYTAIAGTVSFAAGQTSATFSIPLINDVYVEGTETLTVMLSNPVGGVLGPQVSSTLSILDNDLAAGAPNPIDNATFFIRQHYLDFLNREPEASGLAAWVAILNNCPTGDKSCDRVGVSSGFFRSLESFERTYFIYRFYRTALGRKPTYDEYQQDIKRVTGFLTNAQLEARKAEFAEEFVQRADFKALYDSKADGAPYVNAIIETAGVTPSNATDVSNRQGAHTITRGQALRELVESPEISQAFFNEAFVVVGYFAYLRRDPDAAYLVWIGKLNNPPAGQSFEDTYREMIRGFIESLEYRARFGPN